MRGDMAHLNSEVIAGADWEVEQEGFLSLIEPGEYDASCVKVKEFQQYGGLKKLCLTWNFSLSCKEGVLLPQFFNMEHKKFSETTSYYKAWFMANGYKRPSRRTRLYMPPKIFEGVMGTVMVVTVRRKFPDGTDMPTEYDYSKVSFIRKILNRNNGVG